MNDGKFETTDLFVAAYLYAKGMPIEETRVEGGKTAIVFGGNKAKQMQLEYYNGAMVEAIRYKESYISLRQMVNQNKGE